MTVCTYTMNTCMIVEYINSILCTWSQQHWVYQVLYYFYTKSHYVQIRFYKFWTSCHLALHYCPRYWGARHMLELQHHHIMCMTACPHTMLYMMVSTALSLSFRKNQQSSHYTISLLTPPKCITMSKYLNSRFFVVKIFSLEVEERKYFYEKYYDISQTKKHELRKYFYTKYYDTNISWRRKKWITDLFPFVNVHAIWNKLAGGI